MISALRAVADTCVDFSDDDDPGAVLAGMLGPGESLLGAVLIDGLGEASVAVMADHDCSVTHCEDC